MNRHLIILSNAMYVLSALLGVPALAGTFFFGWAAFSSLILTPKPAQPGTPGKTQGFFDLVQTATSAFGSILGFLGGIADAIIIGLAILSVCVLVFAIFLVFTARGIRRRRTWARWLAFALMLWLGFVSIIAALSAGIGTSGMAFLLVAAGSGYAVWVLLRCFAIEPPPNPTPYPQQPYPYSSQ